MSQIAVTLPDGAVKTVPAGTTAGEVASLIGRRLGEAALAAKVDDQLVDLTLPLRQDCRIAVLTADSPEGLEVLRHSTAHLLAQALKELFPGTQLTIGPVIEDGFFYDVDCPKTLTPEDLPAIEDRMGEISGRKLGVLRREIPRKEAIELFGKMREGYKVELIQGFPDGEPVSAYGQGDFLDLCRGPHVPNTGKLGHFKLLSIAGAYWRGNENNKMLQRVYGTTFATKKALDEYLHRLEEARKRDHRRLGPELGLFTFLPIAPAMPFYLPKGTVVVNRLVEFMRGETAQRGYQEVICPQLMSNELWKRSGHWEHYRENMFILESGNEGQSMGLKPMNCPGHCSLYAAGKHSYRELPLRFSEFTKLHRNERAGVTHGILRTRTFSQDDAHIFCTESQIETEAVALIRHTFEVYAAFGFEHVDVKLATRPEKFMGTAETWDKAEDALRRSLEAAGRTFTVVKGEGAFYGPKIEFHIRDSIGRYWQCGTVQLDFALPERFELEYIDSDGKGRRPVMIHRAILGSLERFLGILIEHHNGHFPFWLAPVQVAVMNVTDEQADYANRVGKTIRDWGVRATVDTRNEKLGYKIREAQMQRIPLMLVLGNKEKDSSVVSIRKGSGETLPDFTFDRLREYLEPLLRPGGPGSSPTLEGNTH